MKVSVLVTTYNQEEYIAQAIRSVLMQEVSFDYEILIGEDCSTDSTRDIVVDLQRRDPDKIRLLLPRKNLGFFGNVIFKRILGCARGEYVALLDGDDYWTSPHKLKKQIDFLGEHPDCSMCFHDVSQIQEDGGQGQWDYTPPNRREMSSLEDLLPRNFIATSSVVFRRDQCNILPTSFYKVTLSDWLLHTLNARQGKIGYIDEVMGVHRFHSGGVWSKRSYSEMLEGEIQFYKSLKPLLDPSYQGTIQAEIAKRYDLLDGEQKAVEVESQLQHMRRDVSHQRLVGRVRETVREKLPPDAKVIVVNEGDEQLLELDGRWGWHFPQREGGEPEKLFAQGAQGSEEAPWISTRMIHRFRLYAGTEHESLLAAVEVRRGGQQTHLPSSRASGSVARSGEVFIAAEPNPVPAGIGWGKTTITWSTGDGSEGQVYLSMDRVNTGYPVSSSAAAISQLEELRSQGGEYLLVPATAEPWLEHYKGFREYLESAYRTVVHQEDTCLIFDLGESRTDRPNRNPPLVTVVIPCYNQARFLGEAIESTLSQNYPNFEVVVVDDGSTDDTSEVAARYEKMLRFVRQVNQGRSEARNRGLAEGEGEYVVFLDADDRLLPDALEVGARELEAHPECLFVSGHCTLIGHDGSPINAPPQRCVDEDHYLTLLQGNYIWNPASVMYRREVFDSVGGFAAVAEPCEDYDLYLRIARRYPVRCHEQAVVEYRQHDTNTSRDHELMLRSVLAVLDSQRRYVDGNECYERAHNRGVSYYDDYYGGLARHQRLVGRIRETVREKLPPDAKVIVVNEGDEQLLELDGRWGWHFPQREGGEPEKLFAQGAQGSEEAPWIRTGLAYEFRLYAGKEGERGTLLAAVEVRRGGRQIPSPSSGAAGAAAGSSGVFIAAEPNPVPARPGLGKTTLTWSTGDGSDGQVYLSMQGEYAGHYPSSSEDAIAHLEALRAKGGEFLVFPATSLWWLEHYRGFGKYLERTHRCISKDEHCMIYHLS